MVNVKRVERLNKIEPAGAPVVYWMSRDQRVQDNWALLYAREIAMARKQPLAVVFTLSPSFSGATIRQYDFMLRGLELLEEDLAKLNIPLIILAGDPWAEILKFTDKHKTGAVVTDFSPLKISRKWKEAVAGNIKTSFAEVDAHNVVPCRIASGKREYAARTLRPKIERLLPEFLTAIPSMKPHPFKWNYGVKKNDWKAISGTLRVDKKASGVKWLKPGAKEAMKMLRKFTREKLGVYAERRNDPSENFQSDLSPYLHFGHISAQRTAIEIEKSGANIKSKESFMEELVVRKELADNFCFYNPGYDSFSGFPEWAKKTLLKHKKDSRQYIYRDYEFEKASTHDKIWNAAQRELLERGKMHGYMRMYWAKKILEWTGSPEEALGMAIYLNDRYELDGRDPCGYAGIAWSIGGVHDRPWFERPVYGYVRYMSENGIRSKFEVERYISKNK